MALQKVPVPIVLSQGVDTKTDPKQVVVGKLLQLENATFVSPKQIKKAPGYTSLPTAILGDVTEEITEGEGLMGYEGELLLASRNMLYSFAAASNAWSNKGGLLSVSVGGYSVNRDPVAAGAADCALYPGATDTGGLALYAWEEYTGGNTYVNYCVMDTGTQQVVVPSTRLPATTGTSPTGQSPRCFAFGAFLVVTWVANSGTLLQALPIPVNSPSTPATAITIASDVVGGVYDACLNVTNPPFPGQPGTNAIYFAYANGTGGGGVGLGALQSNLTATFVSKISGQTAAGGLSIVASTKAGDDTYSVTYGGTTSVRNFVVDGGLNTVLADTALDNQTISQVGSTYDGTTVTAWYSTQGSPVWESYTNTNTRTASGAGTGALFGYMFVAGKPFVSGGVTFLLMGYASGSAGIQNTYFLLTADKTVKAKILGNGAGFSNPTQNYPLTHGLPQVVLQPDGTYLFAAMVQDLLVSDVSVAQQNLTVDPANTAATSLFSLAGIEGIELTLFEKGLSYARAEMANTLHISGGYLAMYDGAQVVEHGFHLWPEQLSATATSGSATGTYGYIGVYEWTDNQGNRHQSAPSQNFQLVLGGSGAEIDGTHPATVVFPTLKVTQKSNVVLVVYRTEKDGTQWFRATDVSSPTLNDPTVETITITDAVPDASLLAGQNLYTFGGVVENVAPPACSAISTGSNRLWVLSSVNRNQVWYSKQVSPGTPAAFSDLFTLNMDPRGGVVTAIATMDDYEVFFKESSIFIVAGDGPDDTGQQNTFQTPKLVTTDSGCIDPRSVVLYPGGLLYKSAKGIYHLNRGLAAEYVGAEVERFNSIPVVSANLVANFNQVRFNLEDGTQLVYDYFMQQWSTRPLYGLVDAAIRSDQYFYLDTNGIAYAEDPNSYAIAGRSYSLKLQTSWLAVAGVNGFQRVYGMMLLGDWKSPHTLRISIAYDFNPTPTQVVDVTAEQYDPGYWGDGTSWGSDPVWGDFYPLYQFRINFTRQKCSSVQITIEDYEVGVLDSNGQPAKPGEAYSISNLTFICGVKEGWNKLGASRVYPVVTP